LVINIQSIHDARSEKHQVISTVFVTADICVLKHPWFVKSLHP